MMMHVREPDHARVPCRRLRCRRCKAAPTLLIELWDASISFDYNGKTRSHSGEKSEDSPHGVVAECACGHRWLLRKIVQITDLDTPSGEP